MMSDEAVQETDASTGPTRVQIWWRDLDSRDRAGRARLRRADLDGAMIDEATLRLFHRLGGRRPRDLSRIAALATVLAVVRDDSGQGMPFARQVGFTRMPADPQKPEADNKPVLSVLRFRRLMSATDDADLARQLRRAVDLLGGSANVENIKRVVLDWDRPETRHRFAFDYFGAGFAAPAPDTAAATLSPDPAPSARGPR